MKQFTNLAQTQEARVEADDKQEVLQALLGTSELIGMDISGNSLVKGSFFEAMQKLLTEAKDAVQDYVRISNEALEKFKSEAKMLAKGGTGTDRMWYDPVEDDWGAKEIVDLAKATLMRKNQPNTSRRQKT